MSTDAAYVIKKDIRNNPVVRERDNRQKREFARRFLVFVVILGVVIFSVRQQNALVIAGYNVQRLTLELEQERVMNRQLRLNMALLEAPARIETRAEALGLRPARLNETVVLERVPESVPPTAVVASAK